MPEKAKKSPRQVSFSDYKALKDEIIEISEQRFENILTKRLEENNRKIIEEMTERFQPRFDANDIRFDSLEKRITFMTWFIPIVITLVMTAFKLF